MWLASGGAHVRVPKSAFQFRYRYCIGATQFKTETSEFLSIASSMLFRHSGLQWSEMSARGIADKDKPRDVKLRGMETMPVQDTNQAHPPIIPGSKSA